MTSFRIEVEGAGEVIDCPPGHTLLHAGLRHGFGFPYECSSGSCGTCQFQLLAGEFRNLWPSAPGLSERARRKGDRRLACQSVPQSDALIRVTADPRCRPKIRPELGLATLTDVLDVTHDMREFVFKGPQPATFLPGQYVLLELPRVEGARAYSMCNLPNRDGQWRLIVKRKPGGAMTRYLFEEAVPGDMLTLAGPFGMAVLQPEMDEVACIAGGSGLSPMLSIVRGVLERSEPRSAPVQLFYGGRSQRDLVKLPPDLKAAGAAVDFTPAVSEAQGAGWTGARGFIHEIAEQQLSASSRTHVFIAGPPPMVHATLEMLKRRGIERERIHYDSFY